MKNIRLTIFSRFAIVIFLITTILGSLFIVITYFATSYYHEASTELLNKDVAWHIAKFTSPFTASGLSKDKADSVFQNAMVLSPSAEVYFLNTEGRVLYYHADEKDIKEWNINLEPVTKYIAAKGQKYLKGIDPRDPEIKKIFSAAEVYDSSKKLGYIYVILDSRRSENMIELLFGSHIVRLAIQAFVIIILLSLIFTLIYLKRTSKNFEQMISVLEKFEAGDYNARFNEKRRDELQPVTHAFNKMANLLSANIAKVTNSEQERKNFIASISHDLRTPLSIARGYIETWMLQKENTNFSLEQQEQYSQLIYGKVLQIEHMVKQLFELSKIEAIEFQPSKEPFVFSEIVQELIGTFQLSAKEKQINLTCAECLNHVWINADVSMMERVVQNLADNALKNTPAGGSIQVAVTTEKNEVIFSIMNEGKPLSGELVQWINNFEFNKSLVGNRPQKAGLGLLIVQKILQLHQASLKHTVENGMNNFSFRLPQYYPVNTV